MLLPPRVQAWVGRHSGPVLVAARRLQRMHLQVLRSCTLSPEGGLHYRNNMGVNIGNDILLVGNLEGGEAGRWKMWGGQRVAKADLWEPPGSQLR